MSRYNDTPSFQVRFIWNPNVARGFVVALVVLCVILLLSMCTRYSAPEPYVLQKTTPVTLLVLGDGDGTGARSGNLAQKGKAAKGQESPNPLQDASKPAPGNGRNAADPTRSANLIASNNVGQNGRPSPDASSSQSNGKRDGSDDGTGLEWVGSGPGKGLGFGDIDWGGGGNRTVTHKVLPKFLPGTMNTEVKLRFRVLPDGTVSLVWPMRRGGDPRVDQEAMRVLRQWRFNRLTSDVEMEGTITFVFRNS